MVLAVTLENPEGHQVIAISLEMNDVLVVLIGALMVMLAHALQAAAVIADDNRQIVWPHAYYCEPWCDARQT